jgi:hypothetical protein
MHVDAIGQHGESFRRQLQFDLAIHSCARPKEASLLQALEARNTLRPEASLFIMKAV